MLLRLLAVIGAGAIAVFVILAVSTLYVVEGEGIQQATLPSPAAEMRDQLRRSATPAPVRPASPGQEPLTLPVAAAPSPATAAPATVPPAQTPPSRLTTPGSDPTSAAATDTLLLGQDDADRTGSVNPLPTPRVAPAPPAVARQTIEARPPAAERPATKREAKAKPRAPRATEVREKPQETRRKERRGAANCQTYRTYNAKTRTYRSFDGRIRSCP